MSRIGQQPIPLPAGVSVDINDRQVIVRGPLGQLHFRLRPEVTAEISDSTLMVKPMVSSRKTSAFWGLTRSKLAAMVEGVSKGFEKKLEFEGVGYRAALEREDALKFSLGFSHPIEFRAPAGIKFKVEKNTITVFGIDKELVGRVAAAVRALKIPEPYKGKGIRYQGEIVRRKAGKKAVTAAA